jgi:eukaryotic-like serine/threonine-protein kinase
MERWRPGTRFAHYTIVSPLGAGGMGEVYRARDEQLDRDVAVKVLPASTFDDPAARARLLREARAAAALNHPNVCTVYQVGEANGQTFIAMELVEGETLSARLGSGPVPLDDVVRYGRQLADALVHAHDRGVIHRDLKSQNVIVTPDGRVKVLDFGLAKRSADSDVAATHLHLSLTQPGTTVGTLAYMAPEQLRGEAATVASDIWGLGVVLYEMAAGRRPFSGQTAYELSAAILSATPTPLPPHVPSPLRTLVTACLATVEKRPQRASDVRTALERISIEPLTAPPPEPSPLDLTRTAGTALDPRTLPLRARLVRPGRWHVLAAAATVLAIAAAIWIYGVRGPARIATQTFAVLPFENAAKDADLEYLCEGIADSLIKQTSSMRAVRVSNLASVLDLKGVDPGSAGKQLAVDTILAGSLARDGTQLRVSARLVDVPSGRELWRNTYQRDAANLLQLQDEIAGAIMDNGLRRQLSDEERRDLVRHPTKDGEAYDLYLQARYLQRRATEDDYLYSRGLLERAIIRDPNFALAYGALAGTYAMSVTDGYERPTDAWPQVSRNLRIALKLDPDLPEALSFAHAVAFMFDWDWAGAAAAREKLLQYPVGDFDPGALRSLAIELWAIGRAEDALQLARRTRELDRRSGYLAILEADYLLRTGRFDQAVQVYEYATRVERENPNLYFGLAEARFRQGRFDDAIAARRTAHELAGDENMKAVLASARGETGYREIERAWLRVQLEALKVRETTSYVSPLDFARVYAQLGEKELAFKYLDAAFIDRSPGLVFLKVDPAWETIRGDARFADAVRRVKLP